MKFTNLSPCWRCFWGGEVTQCDIYNLLVDKQSK